MRSLLILALLASPALAEPAKKPVRPARHVKQDLTDRVIVVKQDAPKPTVVVVRNEGKAITGRPKSGDRFKGLDQHLAK